MFAKLVDTLLQFIGSFRFIRIIHQWEVGVVLRLGVYHRTLQPGWHLILPFSLEEVAVEWSIPTVKVLPAQSLTTLDGRSVLVTPVITWSCADAYKLTVTVGGNESALLDSACGVVSRHVTSLPWLDLSSDASMASLTSAIRRRAGRWGIKVHEVQFSDVSLSRTYRVVGPPHVVAPGS